MRLFIIDPGPLGITQEQLDWTMAGIGGAFVEEYSALTGVSPAGLLEAIRPYNTVMAAMRLQKDGCAPKEWEAILDFVRGN